jgi:SprT protein
MAISKKQLGNLKLMEATHGKTTLESWLVEMVESVYDTAKARFPGYFKDMPKVYMHNETRASGLANSKHNWVSFHITVAYENQDTFKNTVIHEISHLVTDHFYPNAKQNHGPEFRRIMTALGGTPSRTVDYSMDNLGIRQVETGFMYSCGCQTVSFTKTRHNKVLRGSAYKCGKCNQRFTFVKKEAA